MSFGSSEPWQRIMKIATGESKLSSQPLLEFFQPLMEYLKTTNEKNKEHVGWKQTSKYFPTKLIHQIFLPMSNNFFI